MNRHVKRILVLIVGWAFILLGVVGLFLPILQGILFIAILLSETLHGRAKAVKAKKSKKAKAVVTPAGEVAA